MCADRDSEIIATIGIGSARVRFMYTIHQIVENLDIHSTSRYIKPKEYNKYISDLFVERSAYDFVLFDTNDNYTVCAIDVCEAPRLTIKDTIAELINNMNARNGIILEYLHSYCNKINIETVKDTFITLKISNKYTGIVWFVQYAYIDILAWSYGHTGYTLMTINTRVIESPITKSFRKAYERAIEQFRFEESKEIICIYNTRKFEWEPVDKVELMRELKRL